MGRRERQADWGHWWWGSREGWRQDGGEAEEGSNGAAEAR